MMQDKNLKILLKGDRSQAAADSGTYFDTTE